MSAAAPDGWGGARWGASSWGGAESEDLRLLQAVAIRENAVRLTFSAPPAFDGLLTPNDASNPARYSVTAVAGTEGLDQLPVRAVRALVAELVVEAGAAGTLIDLYVDRPFSPWPARYYVACNNLATLGTQLPLDPSASFREFQGVRGAYSPNTAEAPVPLRDVANPQTRGDAASSLPTSSSLVLGAYAIDDTGDYAMDEGLANLRKRILRRLVTARGAFAFLPDYGVGVAQNLKRLNAAAVRNQLAEEARRQILLEPDVAACSVAVVQRAVNLVVFVILVRTTAGVGAKMEEPFSLG